MTGVSIDRNALAGMPLPEPKPGSKEDRGRVLVVAGSRELVGAAILSGTAALRIGAGKLQLCAPESVAIALGAAIPEGRVFAQPETDAGGIKPKAAGAIAERAGACQALLVGPGLIDPDATATLVERILSEIEAIPILLDAAAMMRVRDQRDVLARHPGRIAITPHFGEMAGILGIDKGEIEADPSGTARRAADDLGVVVVLKGACSFIAEPGGRWWSCDHGNVGLATSGSGDTLAGFIAGLMARGAEPAHAALWGVYVHGEAGQRLAKSRGPLGFLARELPDDAPAILADLAR